jgi:hypothetical protein
MGLADGIHWTGISSISIKGLKLKPMKKLNVIFFALILMNITSCGQVKKTSNQKQGNLIKSELLVGKWRSEDDAKYMLVFEKGKYSELYDKDTTDNMYYKLSGSCNLKDSSSKIDLQKAFLLFYSNDSVQQCNEILNLTSDVLSWMNNKNGKIFVFRKVK